MPLGPLFPRAFACEQESVAFLPVTSERHTNKCVRDGGMGGSAQAEAETARSYGPAWRTNPPAGAGANIQVEMLTQAPATTEDESEVLGSSDCPREGPLPRYVEKHTR